jgi:hypothetical protein
MSDKPSPKNLPSNFVGVAFSVLIGSIALYLAVQLLRAIAVPLIVGSIVIGVVWLLWMLRRLRRPEQW